MNARSLALRPDTRPSAAHAVADQALNDFQSEIAEIVGAPYPRRAASTIWVLTTMVVVAIFLSTVLTLDKVVEAQGRLVARTQTILVQPLENSVLRTINVRVGQTVKTGELLATLDPTISTADVVQLRQQSESLKAQVTRLEAEQNGSVPALSLEGNQSERLQASIWQHRKSEREARLAVFEERIRSTTSQITSGKRDAEHYRDRLAVSSKIEDMRTELARKEIGSQLNVLIAKDNRAEIARNLTSSEQQIRTATHELASVQAERDAYLQEWQSSVAQELAARRTDLQQVEENLSKAEYLRNLVELRAVADATVISIADRGSGSVVPSGEVLISLMPVDAPVEVEADIAGSDQGFVKVGDPVQIKLDAYMFTEHGMAKGIVRAITEDSFTRLDNGQPSSHRFFKARIEITDTSGLRKVPLDLRLLPGMPLTADIVVGERSIIRTLLGRFEAHMTQGLREPN